MVIWFARGLLADAVGPFREAYIDHLDALAAALGLETAPDSGELLSSLPFQKRLAVLLGATGGNILSHLDPLLNLSLPNYRHREDLPSAQTAALFHFMTNDRLLDAVESLVGLKSPRRRPIT